MDERSDLRVCLATLLQQLRHSYAQVDFTGSALGDLAAVPSNLLMKDLFQGFLPLTQKDNFEDIAVSSGTLGGASRRGGVNVKKFNFFAKTVSQIRPIAAPFLSANRTPGHSVRATAFRRLL